MELVAIPSRIAVEATSALLPLAGTTSTHCIVSIDKAQRELGCRPVIEGVDALAETLDWYERGPSLDPDASPSLTDRFDYGTEDALIAEYRAATEHIDKVVEQRPAPPVHSMPHPKAPGVVDHRGR
jgi:hypothetical protein